MPAKKLDKVVWYSDPKAHKNKEPGIQHSYVASLASCLDYAQAEQKEWMDRSLSPTVGLILGRAATPSDALINGKVISKFERFFRPHIIPNSFSIIYPVIPDSIYPRLL